MTSPRSWLYGLSFSDSDHSKLIGTVEAEKTRFAPMRVLHLLKDGTPPASAGVLLVQDR